MIEYKFYSTNEVAKILGVTRRTIYNYIKAEELKAVKIGKNFRIPIKELERFIREGTSNDYYDKIK